MTASGRRFDEMVRLWARGAGFADIRARWLAVAAGLGGPVRVASARDTREGLFEGLDASGRLLLRTASGLEDGRGRRSVPDAADGRAESPMKAPINE